MKDATYKLDELAAAAGVSARTVRYYVQRGLLPGPVFRGKDSHYGAEHLVRLRAVKRLQDRWLPLDEIQAELARRSLAELERLADGHDLPQVPAAPVRPGPAPAPAPALVREEWTTWQIAPGLTVSLAGHATEDVRALAEELLARVRAAPKK